MNIKIKNNVLLIMAFVMLCFVSTTLIAQAPDHRFNYQGELTDGGEPANGSYDITISPFFSLSGNLQGGMVSEHLNVTVNDGLFVLNNVDIDDPTGVAPPFDGGELFLQVAVRPNGVVGAYTILSPRQQIHAVPYANNITKKGATNGQVLTYKTGVTSEFGEWLPETIPSSPWSASGPNINFSNNVGIGTSDPIAQLHVESNIPLIARFEGPDRMSVNFFETGVRRGYVGSVYAGSNSNLEDFEIGTDNTVGNMHITTNQVPRITVTPNGNVGIGTITPAAKLTVDGDAQLNGEVEHNGLTIHNGDVKQFNDRNGGLKYMVKATCGLTGSNIIRSYIGALGTGASGSGTSILILSGPTDGRCRISFPSFIHERYWVVSPNTDANRSSNCKLSSISNTTLDCRSYTPNTGVGITTDIIVLVY